MAHRSAKLTPWARLTIAQRVVELRRPAAVVAEEMNVSRATVYKWVRRYREGGAEALNDRSSAPHCRPRALTERQVQRVLARRAKDKTGPHRLAAQLGMARSTVYGVLRRHGLSRLDHVERVTGTRTRWVVPRPGQLGHLDVKKLGRIPDGGGHRALGRQAARRHKPSRGGRLGYDYLHTLLDACTRIAYTEILADERGTTCAAFLIRAAGWFAQQGIHIEAVMTDEAKNYTLSKVFAEALFTIGARHKTTGPYRPQWNGKVERFHRTLLDEWAYARFFQTNRQRSATLPGWLHRYNHRRPHTALGGLSPFDFLSTT